jgi:hypothetical protein
MKSPCLYQGYVVEKTPMSLESDLQLLSAMPFYQLLDDMAVASETLNTYVNSPSEMLTRWAGSGLASMRRSSRQTVTCLGAKQVPLQLSAILLVRDHLPPTAETASALLPILIHHDDAIVRGVALYALQRLCGWIDFPTDILEQLLVSLEGHHPESALSIIEALRFFTSIMKGRRTEWTKLVGSLVSEMLCDLECVERGLTDSDSRIRYVALKMMSGEWPPTPAGVTAAYQILHAQHETELYNDAVLILSQYYAGTNDKAIGGCLASIVYNESFPTQARLKAYAGLYDIRGTPIVAHPTVRAAPKELRFPEDVDWSFVASFGK